MSTHRRVCVYAFPRVAIAIIRETILSCCLGIEEKKKQTCVLNVLADLFGAYMWVCVWLFFSAAVKPTER